MKVRRESQSRLVQPSRFKVSSLGQHTVETVECDAMPYEIKGMLARLGTILIKEYVP